jgi:hypothetical protein
MFSTARRRSPILAPPAALPLPVSACTTVDPPAREAVTHDDTAFASTLRHENVDGGRLGVTRSADEAPRAGHWPSRANPAFVTAGTLRFAGDGAGR